MYNFFLTTANENIVLKNKLTPRLGMGVMPLFGIVKNSYKDHSVLKYIGSCLPV